MEEHFGTSIWQFGHQMVREIHNTSNKTMKTTKGFSVLVWLGLYSYILPPKLMTYLLPSCVTLRTHSMARKSRQETNMLIDLNTNIKT